MPNLDQPAHVTNYDALAELQAMSADNVRLRAIIATALAHLGDQSMARCDRITWAIRALQSADPNGPQGTD